RGFGGILAEGSATAASVFGGGAEECLLEVKGQELPLHDPRTKTGVGLQYAVSPFGADHWFAQHDTLFTKADAPGFIGAAPLGMAEPVPATDLSLKKVRLIYYTSLLTSIYDCLGICVFGAVSRGLLPLPLIIDIVNGATGWNTNLWELMKVGERAVNMARVFNRRAGLTRRDDRLPSRFFTPLKGGPLDGTSALVPAEFEKALDLYYQMSGCDLNSGAPSDAKLSELDLGWLTEKNNAGE
ncbi:MAG: aldehyde ferredoxin oxidoreductase, partial [Methanomicrobiales archaeon HGW-Methanomicrobiales-5]